MTSFRAKFLPFALEIARINLSSTTSSRADAIPRRWKSREESEHYSELGVGWRTVHAGQSTVYPGRSRCRRNPFKRLFVVACLSPAVPSTEHSFDSA